ncbi:MAG: putative DNA binding domain-containing protein [Oscillospiraceae bacterium]|nr:putative DNA binding domain-containing protein [Oscillospiraceae bacterium]
MDKINAELIEILYGLIKNWENEVVEFKQASNDYRLDDIGKYFSAISNEANLKGLQYGWFIFGVNNKSKAIVGSNYRNTRGLETLKHEIAQDTTGNISFVDIFEVYDDGRRVVMFKIPAAVIAMPTAWKNHWYGREGESLGALSMEELDRLRGQVRRDWSKELIDGSTIAHLDADAVRIARENYKEKQNSKHISEEIDRMSDADFLSKLKLVIHGKLTNAAMALLGNSDYDYLMDTQPRIMWRLYGSDNAVKDYMEFTMPFILVVDKVYAKVRNLTYRYMPNQMTLFPTETKQYDASLLRELLNNSIAHSEYTVGMRIYLDEYEDQIIISNAGTFLPGDIEAVLKPSYTAPYYRNQLLADTMTKFNMIDTVQMGIQKVFRIQKERYFPLPDYDLSTPQKVAVKIYGKVLDENYSRVLFDHPEFDLETVFLIDKVQKRIPLEKEQLKRLRALSVVEGKAPYVYISAHIAEMIDEKAQYIRNRGFDDDFYKRMIREYLAQFGSGKKKDFMALLLSKLPDVLSDRQKEYKVQNLLKSLKRSGDIQLNSDNPRMASWVLRKPD